eukprot:7541537-Ditylum_brightwellii.AAC.1
MHHTNSKLQMIVQCNALLFKLNADYVEDYCAACSNCSRRKMDDAGDKEDGYEDGTYNVDCDECQSAKS